jgi:hypothetical protein
MAIPTVDFTNREEEGIRDEMIRRKPFLTPEWTDDNDADLGNALIDEFVASLSVLHFYVDKAAGEGFIWTAVKRESLEKLLFFWNIPGKVPATVNLRFSITANQGQDVDIPALTQCQTVSETSPVFFETDSLLTLKYELLTADTAGTDLINCDSSGYVVGQLVEIGDDDTTSIQRTILSIPGGTQLQLDSTVPVGFTTAQNAFVAALNGTVDATEGKTTTETLDNSDGTAFQTRRSINENIIDETIALIINEGGGDVTWTVPDNNTFYESTPTSEEFIWKRKWDDTVLVILGDDAQGKVPVNGSTMVLSFREGGGIIGNVGETTVTQLNDTILVGGTAVAITVTNLADASGGSDRMSNEEAKIRGPEILKANDRYISQSDYITGAKSVFGVGNANAVRVTQPGVLFNVAIYIIPTGGGLPSTTLKDAVEAELLSKGSIRVVPEVFDPGLAKIALGGTVFVLSNFIQAEVEVAVEAALATFFQVNNVDFGQAIRESDISRVIDEVTGVDYVDITKLTLIPRADDIDYNVWTGDAVVGDVTVGTSVISETWTITFTSPTTFNVRGSISGIQIATGSLDVLYTSDNGEVSFTITSGISPHAVSDNASFRTSNYRGNVLVEENEIAVLDTNDLTYSGGG